MTPAGRRRLLVFAAAAALAVGLAAVAWIQRRPGWNPASLWLDDLWMAVLARSASLWEIWTLPYPAPPGFILALKACTAVLGPAAWAFQLLPLAFAFAGVALAGLLGARLTGSRWIGAAAAMLLALNPTTAIYSLRVKAYTLEAVATLVILWLAIEAWERSGRLRWGVAAAALLAVPFAFNAVFLGSVMVAGLAASRGPRPFPARGAGGWSAWGPAAFYGTGFALIYVLLLRPRTTPALIGYWTGGFLPLDGWGPLRAFVTDEAAAFFTGAFPLGLPWLAFLVPLGLWGLLREPRTRPLGACLLLFYAALFAASAFHRYPLGRGRTDIFAFPVTILVACAGAAWLTRRPRVLRPMVPLALLAWLCLAPQGEVRFKYPESGARSVVERAAALVEEGDGLVVYPYTNHAAALYGRWPFHLEPAADTANGFYAMVDRPRTLMLREAPDGVNFNGDPRVLERQMAPFLAAAPDRVAVIANRSNPLPLQGIRAALQAAGYGMVHREEFPEQALVLLWRRLPPGPPVK